jgi:hypothetical protein
MLDEMYSRRGQSIRIRHAGRRIHVDVSVFLSKDDTRYGRKAAAGFNGSDQQSYRSFAFAPEDKIDCRVLHGANCHMGHRAKRSQIQINAILGSTSCHPFDILV